MASQFPERSSASKIQTLSELSRLVSDYQSQGKSVVHCHGVFDPLHIGHIRHFEDARRFGEVLIVTVTPDRFVNKGPHRPVFSENLRAEAIAALSVVDFVAVNEWPTAVETIKLVKPNIFVKGSEFLSRKDVTGAISDEEQAILSVGGRLEFTDDLVFSASNLVNRHLSVFPPSVVEYLSDFAQRYSVADILQCLTNASRIKVLVIGETIIDDYQYVEAIGKSQKDPTLVVKALSKERFVAGASAISNHLAGFSKEVSLYSLLGDSPSHEDFIREKLKKDIRQTFIYRKNSPTIVKRRFIDQYFFSKLFEVYEINDTLLSTDESAELIAGLKGKLGEFDLVIASDFGHGMFTDEMIDLVCQESRFLVVNTQSNAGNLGFNLISRYSRANYVVLAEAEMRLEARDRRGDLKPMISRLSKQLKNTRMVVTRGSKGCLGYSPDEGFVEVPAFAGRVVDRIGAGDAFFAITSLCAAQDIPLEVLAFIGNVVGSQAVASVGHRDSIELVPLCRHIEHLLK